MRLRRLGSQSALVPVLGIGTWNMEIDDRRGAIAAIRRAVEHGMTHVDTAELYGDGEVETIVGEALAGLRDQVYLVSKLLPRNASYRGTLRACEASLRRLGTDRLDCYLLHWREQLPLDDTFRAFEALHEQGKIRAWGVSNFDDADLGEAFQIVGPGKIACNQVLYHLKERAIEHAVVPWCERHGVAVVAYSPFGHDDFPAPSSAGGKLLQDIAKAHAATPRQVALAFLTRGPSLLAIPKASSAEHAAENAAAGALDLSRDEVAAIDQAFPRGPKPRGLPML